MKTRLTSIHFNRFSEPVCLERKTNKSTSVHQNTCSCYTKGDFLFLIDVHATIVLSGRKKKAKTRDEKQKLTYLASLFKLSPRIHLSITVKTNENILIITWGLYIYIYIYIHIYMYIIYKCVANAIIVTIIIIHNYRNVQIVLSHLAS